MNQCQVPDHVRKRVAVLGVGNSLFGDDGFGPATVQLILTHEVPSDVCVLDVGTGVMPILFDILLSDSAPRRLIILDTVDLGRAPGDLVRVPVDQLPKTRNNLFSFHSFSARRILQELEETKGVEVVILACQAESIPSEVREGLSIPVQDAVHRAAQVVLQMMRV